MQLVMMILDLPLEDGIGGLKWSKSKWSKSFSFRKKKKKAPIFSSCCTELVMQNFFNPENTGA